MPQVWQFQHLGPCPGGPCILHVLGPGYSSLLLGGWKNCQSTDCLTSAGTFQEILHMGAGTLTVLGITQGRMQAHAQNSN